MIPSLLDAEYEKIAECDSAYVRTQIAFTIINIKIDNPKLVRHVRPLYDDIKSFIADYIKSIDSLTYGYDVLDVDKIFFAIEALPGKEGIALHNHLIRLLKNSGFENEYHEALKNRNKLRLRDTWKTAPHWYVFRWILFHSSKSFGSLVLSVLAFLLLIALVLLPTKIEALQLFKIEYQPFSDYFLLNHTLNLVCHALEIGDGISIVPLNSFALFVFIIGKIALIIIVGNFLIQEITRKLAE